MIYVIEHTLDGKKEESQLDATIIVYR